MRKLLNLFFLTLSMFASKAQLVRIPVAAVYTRMPAYTSHFSDAFSFAANQAALADVPAFSFGIYSERRFMLRELSLYHAAVAVPTRSGTFGAQGIYSGNSGYNESSLGLAYARKLGAKLNVGVQFNYQSLTVTSYGMASTVSFEAGLLFNPVEKLHLGMHVYNPTAQKLGKDGNEALPAIYTTGIGYEVSDKFFAAAEIQKEEGQPVGMHAGMQYSFDSRLFARGGFSSATESFYLGLGVRLTGFRLDATASLHPQLGMTPGIMLVYQSSKPKNEE